MIGDDGVFDSSLRNNAVEVKTIYFKFLIIHHLIEVYRCIQGVYAVLRMKPRVGSLAVEVNFPGIKGSGSAGSLVMAVRVDIDENVDLAESSGVSHVDLAVQIFLSRCAVEYDLASQLVNCSAESHSSASRR